MMSPIIKGKCRPVFWTNVDSITGKYRPVSHTNVIPRIYFIILLLTILQQFEEFLFSEVHLLPSQERREGRERLDQPHCFGLLTPRDPTRIQFLTYFAIKRLFWVVGYYLGLKTSSDRKALATLKASPTCTYALLLAGP